MKGTDLMSIGPIISFPDTYTIQRKKTINMPWAALNWMALLLLFRVIESSEESLVLGEGDGSICYGKGAEAHIDLSLLEMEKRLTWHASSE